MTDTNKLKELAERATPTGWTHDADRYVVAQSDQVNDGWNICLCEGPDSKKNRDFIAAANPQAILGLIAEVERLASALQEAGDLAASSRTGPGQSESLRIIEEITAKAVEHRDGRLSALERAVGAETERNQLRAELEEYDDLKADLGQCASALPGTYYMDPPDGGNVSIPEQIRRMAKDAARYRALRQKQCGDVVVRDRASHLFGERLDAEIDAAIEGAKQ
ncbi:TPA: hypothetical protein SLW25_001540 [Pseudomonas aeruginosa]|nr:hypothetical protein [Pseudomonas aeruginosa]